MATANFWSMCFLYDGEVVHSWQMAVRADLLLGGGSPVSGVSGFASGSRLADGKNLLLGGGSPVSGVSGFARQQTNEGGKH
jgi:hypothetical protein